MRPWLFNFTALLVASLTFMGQASGTSNQWNGTVDAFSRVGTENNDTILSSTFGHVNGQATLTATLDNQPMAITAEGTNAMIWNAQIELTPGQHQLIIAAAHPSGQFTAYATNTFTNSIAYQTTADTYDGAGNVTNRVWLNPNGTTNRVQTFSWDARGRLHAKTERDANNSGYNWSTIYDALDRRLSTTSYAVTNGVVLSTLPNTINSYYDPETEFLELGVAYGTKMVWKLYGPDADGTYGGENGTGGFDGYTPMLNLFNPTVSDLHGNILGMATNGGVAWNSARTTAYGAVPGYRPVPLANGGSLIQSSAMGGRWPDIDGDYNIGRRPYRPPSAEWETYDPIWNESDPNWYTYCGGDPGNHGDWNGMLAKTAGNYAVGLEQGFVQGYFGINTGPSTDTANYNGQYSGRNFAGAVALWMTVDGTVNTGTGLGIMAGSALTEGVTAGVSTPVTGPTFVAGGALAGAGTIQTSVGAYGLYNFMNLTPLQLPSSGSGGGGSQNSSSLSSTSGQSSRQNDSENVDLTDAKGNLHILYGEPDGGGGHAPGTGISGKSEFPASWSNDKILNTVSDIATDPDQIWSAPDPRGYITTTKTVDGVDVKVVFDTNKGRIVTGFPTNLPKNP